MSATRRQVLRLLTAGGATVVLSGAADAAWAGRSVWGAAAARRTRVYVLVVDGCRPEEVGSGLMPQLQALRSAGLDFPAARSLPVTETLPNHVMMMTGVRPDRSGVPANTVYDRDEGVVRTMDRPDDIRVTTVIEQLNAAGGTTGTVLSKEYLYDIFGERATYRWEPQPVVPVSGHAPDVATVDALVAMVDEADPDLVFCNLGDVDRMGHADLSGTTVRAARQAALLSTDGQVGRFVEHLRATGRWESSVLVVLADHSMDWSIPTNIVSVEQILSGRPELAEHTVVAQNGGANLLAWTGPAGERSARLAEIRALVAAHPGVLEVVDPGDLRLGSEAGDVVCTCRAGWRFTDPTVLSNPIPGNHGHPVTEPIPFFVSGGHPDLPRGVSSSEPARTVDVAPTVGAILGLKEPEGGWDGTARLSLPKRPARVTRPRGGRSR